METGRTDGEEPRTGEDNETARRRKLEGRKRSVLNLQTRERSQVEVAGKRGVKAAAKVVKKNSKYRTEGRRRWRRVTEI